MTTPIHLLSFQNQESLKSQTKEVINFRTQYHAFTSSVAHPG